MKKALLLSIILIFACAKDDDLPAQTKQVEINLNIPKLKLLAKKASYNVWFVDNQTGDEFQFPITEGFNRYTIPVFADYWVFISDYPDKTLPEYSASLYLYAGAFLNFSKTQIHNIDLWNPYALIILEKNGNEAADGHKLEDELLSETEADFRIYALGGTRARALFAIDQFGTTFTDRRTHQKNQSYRYSIPGPTGAINFGTEVDLFPTVNDIILE